jgi:Fic family protein
MERNRIPQPLLYLSAYIDKHKSDYYDLLQRVRTHGDWNPWLRFFLQGVVEVSTAAGQQAKELHRLREEYRALLRDKPNSLIILDELFINPYITISKAGKVLGKTPPTAKAAISVLEERKILKEVSGRQWGRFYVSQPILDALEKPLT